MSFCRKCGTSLRETGKFCPNCGTPGGNAAMQYTEHLNLQQWWMQFIQEENEKLKHPHSKAQSLSSLKAYHSSLFAGMPFHNASDNEKACFSQAFQKIRKRSVLLLVPASIFFSVMLVVMIFVPYGLISGPVLFLPCAILYFVSGLKYLREPQICDAVIVGKRVVSANDFVSLLETAKKPRNKIGVLVPFYGSYKVLQLRPADDPEYGKAEVGRSACIVKVDWNNLFVFVKE